MRTLHLQWAYFRLVKKTMQRLEVHCVVLGVFFILIKFPYMWNSIMGY